MSHTYDRNDRLLTEAKDVAGTTTEDRFTRYEYGAGNNGTQQTKKTVRAGVKCAIPTRIRRIRRSHAGARAERTCPLWVAESPLRPVPFPRQGLSRFHVFGVPKSGNLDTPHAWK